MIGKPTNQTRIIEKYRYGVMSYIVERLYQFTHPSTKSTSTDWKPVHVDDSREGAEQIANTIAKL